MHRSTSPAARQPLSISSRTAVLFVALFCALPYAAHAVSPPLTLNEALSIATHDSAALAAQRAAITAAGHATVYARELPDPRLRLGIENLPTDGPDRYSLTRDFMTMRKIGVMQDFPRAEKRELKGRRAEQALAREQAMLGSSSAMVRRDVASAWFERYYAERMAGVIDEQYAETTLQREAAEAGLRANKIQAWEVRALEVALQSLLDRRADFNKQAARATAMLSRWLGAASSRPLAAAVPELRLAQHDLAAHVSQHPHLQTLDREIEVTQIEADLARAAAKPDWGLELAYAQRGPQYSNMISFQVSIDLPIFQARRQQPALAEKQAQVEQARALREDALRQHLADARVAQAEWDAATGRLNRFDNALLPLARERGELALAAYRGGQAALAPALEARRAELELKLQKLQLELDQGRAYAQLLYFLPEEAAR